MPWGLLAAIMLAALGFGCSNDTTGFSNATAETVSNNNQDEDARARQPVGPSGSTERNSSDTPSGSDDGDDSDGDQLDGDGVVTAGGGEDDGDDDDDNEPQYETKSFNLTVDNRLDAPKPVDYVLVLDNSSSMPTAIANARAGLMAAIDNQVFNANARIGVMSSMPAKLDDLTKIHDGVGAVNANQQGKYKSREAAATEPGFMALAKQSQLEAFQTANSGQNTLLNRWEIDLCANGFFSPYQEHAREHLCLEAAMQTSLIGLGVEDGIISFHQMVQAQPQNLFRTGAEVNIFFISDVHAPGISCNDATNPDHKYYTLCHNRPTPQMVRDAVLANSNVSKVSFHAIAPRQVVSGCSESASQWGAGETYFEFTNHPNYGGNVQDICNGTDYSEFFRDTVTEAQAKDSYTIPLPAGVDEPTEVKVNGQAVDGYEYKADSREIVLNLMPLVKEMLQVEIKYQSLVQ